MEVPKIQKITELTSKCPICRDTGWVFIPDAEGNEYAKLCECRYPAKRESILRHCGYDYERLKDMTLDTFKTDTKETEEMLNMAIRFIADDKATGIGYFGQSGSGKTHICLAICQELVQRRMMSFMYFSYREGMQKLRSVYFDDCEYQRMLQEICDMQLLYIDDFLKFSLTNQGNINQNEMQTVYDIVNRRYINRRLTIFSSELSVNEIMKIDEAIGSRIYSMINPYGYKCKAENRRLRK